MAVKNLDLKKQQKGGREKWFKKARKGSTKKSHAGVERERRATRRLNVKQDGKVLASRVGGNREDKIKRARVKGSHPPFTARSGNL